jgi:hypothetical protein
MIAAYQQVGTYRGAAEICGTTYKTVKRIIQAHLSGEDVDAGRRPRTPRRHNYDAVADLVAEKVRTSKVEVSAKRLLPAARAGNYERSARDFRRLVSDAKEASRSGQNAVAGLMRLARHC